MATIRKRGPYQFQVFIRKAGFPHQSKTFESKADATAWAAQIESEMHRGVFVTLGEAEDLSLENALDRYYREISSKKRHPQQELQRVNRWKMEPLAEQSLAALRGSDFAKYRDRRRQEGRAENTIRLELALVSHLFEIARKEWGMEGLANPLKNIRKPSGSNERDRRLRPGEYEKLAEALSACANPWVRPMFDFAIETALRQGMLFELRWDWVNFDKSVIAIPKKYQGTGNKGVAGTLPLSSKARSVLAALPINKDGKIFRTSQNALVCAWKRALKRVDIEDLRWHDLRHEAASRLFEKGLNPMEVASITGHKSLTMLRRYTHLSAVDLVSKLG